MSLLETLHTDKGPWEVPLVDFAVERDSPVDKAVRGKLWPPLGRASPVATLVFTQWDLVQTWTPELHHTSVLHLGHAYGHLYCSNNRGGCLLAAAKDFPSPCHCHTHLPSLSVMGLGVRSGLNLLLNPVGESWVCYTSHKQLRNSTLRC